MKKMIFTLVFSLCAAVSLSAMNYEEAREQARFLTDKMAYELNLNDQQYNDCYEINLDYLLSVRTEADLYGDYLTYRNSDIRHILYDWQYTLFAAADYFFRPLSWFRGAWLFPIYNYYSLGHYYYNYPSVYYSYRGGHGRYYYRGGYYYSRRPHWNGGFRGHDRGPISHRGPGHPSHRPGHPSHRPGHPSHRPGHGPSHHGSLSHHGSPSHHGGAPSHRSGGAPSHRSSSGTYHMGGGSSHHLSSHSSGSRPNMDARAQGHSGYSHPSSTRATVNSGSHHSSSMSGRSSAPSRSSFSGASTRSGASHSGGHASFGGSRGGSHGGGSHGGGGSHHGGGRGR